MAGVGLYEVGVGKTYATPNLALAALFADQGSVPFTQEQEIVIYNGTYTSPSDAAVMLVGDFVGTGGLVPTSDYHLVIRNAVGNFPILDATFTAKSAFQVANISYVDFEGLDCRDAVWYIIGLNYGAGVTTTGTTHITVRNCKIHGVLYRFGILFVGINDDSDDKYKLTDCIVEDNEIYDCKGSMDGGSGINFWTNCHNNIVRNNDIHDCNTGISISAQNLGLLDSIGNNIINNEVYNNVGTDIDLSLNILNTVDGNICHGSHDGIKFRDYALIKNNLVYDEVGYGISVAKNFVEHIKIYNNISTENRYGFYLNYAGNAVGDNEVKNNIFANNSEYQVNITNSNIAVVCDFNCIYQGTGTYLCYGSNGSVPANETLWKAYGNDAHGIFVDPLFIDEVNFQIDYNSPCIDAGDNSVLTDVPIDILGNIRPGVGYASIIDIGCYERSKFMNRIPVLENFAWQSPVLEMRSSPPISPAPVKGDVYIVVATVSGDWAGHEKDFALYDGTNWLFYTPDEATVAWVKNESKLYIYKSSVWVVFFSLITQDDVVSGTTYKQFSSTEQVKLSNVKLPFINTFVNSDLVAGILTVTHNYTLPAPYSLHVSIFDNTNKMIVPDEITGAANSVAIDLSSFGTLTGTWGYCIGV